MSSRCAWSAWATMLTTVQQVTIRLEHDTIAYFKGLSEEMGIPYRTLINLYLRECASSRKRLALTWRPAARQGAA